MEPKISELINKMTLEEKVALCSGRGKWQTTAISRLKIPSIVMTDGTSGVRFNKNEIETTTSESGESAAHTDEGDEPLFATSTDFIDLNQESELLKLFSPATCFPSGSAIACSWDIDLLESIGRALGQECQYLGVNLLLAPGVNIRRHPLGGRGYEYYSEDPCVTGELGAAFVKGVQSEGVGTCVKHFVCNNSEYQRTRMSSEVGERALREIYCASFERIIRKSRPWAIMSSYNRVNGVQVAEDRHLLKGILRDELGFNGLIISDWWAIKDRIEAAVAGNDLEMPENPSDNKLLEAAVRTGQLDIMYIDEMCGNILDVVFKANNSHKIAASMDFSAHHELARKAAAESAVLLKNTGQVLPIDRNRVSMIAVIGEIAINPRYQGAGSATIHPTFLDIPLEEIRKKAGANIQVEYAAGYSRIDEANEKMVDEAVKIAEKADVAVVFAGLAIAADSEGSDRIHLEIADAHKVLLEALSNVQPNTVVVLCNGDAVTMESWLPDVAGVLEVFYNGQAGGGAIADILFGDVNPSGKLTVTFPRRLEDTPAFLHFPGENGEHLYSEGIHVGYRYYDRREIEPRFPFGYGMSYTTFEYSNLHIKKKRIKDTEKLTFDVKIHNTGNRFGKEVVQVYLVDKKSRLIRPEKELKAFKKVALEPGEAAIVDFDLEYRDFCYYDPEFGEWVMETGEFELLIGRSSRDICLQETIYVEGTKTCHPILRLDSVHSELLSNPIAKQMYVDFLKKKDIVTEENKDRILAIMENSFVGIYNHLTWLMRASIVRGDLQTLLDEINAELQSQSNSGSSK